MTKFCVFLVCLFSLPLSAAVFIQEGFQHYLIAPKSVADIKLELRKKSPVVEEDQTFHGRTTWTVVPNFRWKRRGAYCHIEEVSVRLTTRYEMPRLSGEEPITDEIRSAFDAYYQALLDHEKGHHAFGVEAAEAIESLLLDYDPKRSCRDLEDSATAEIWDIINHYQAQNKAYDKTTGHGRTQGAVIR